MFLSDRGLECGRFAPEVQAVLPGFQAVLDAANEMRNPQLLPDHFLVALLRANGSCLAKDCAVLGLPPAALASAIGTAIAGTTVTAHKEPTRDLIAPETETALRDLEAFYGSADVPPGRQEALLSAKMLRNCTPRTLHAFGYGGVNVPALIEKYEKMVLPPDLKAFAEDGSLLAPSFDRIALRILRRVESEGRSLGLDSVGTPLLLLALVGHQDGLTDRALRSQQASPRVLYEALVLRLQALGRKGQLSELKLVRSQVQEAAQRVLEAAARDAMEHDSPLIGEAHLLRALVEGDPMLCGGTLRENRVKPDELMAYALRNHTAAEPEEKAKLSVAEVVRGLRERIVGQDHVAEAIEPLLKRLEFNYGLRNKPVGVFLFLGPSGTGKTETAKTLAKFVYGSEDQIVFLEMGQFGSEYDKSIFVGAPPGYKGFGEGQLTNGLRDKPESVILFDEVEKAHKTVFDVLLRFLDEGVIMDPAGPVRDGRKCLLILTSNIQLKDACDLRWEAEPEERRGDGPHVPTLKELYALDGHSRQAVIRKALGRIEFFRPEFVNRVEEIVLFKELTLEDFAVIARRQVAAEAARMEAEKDRRVTVDQEVVDFIGARAFTRRDEGARAVGKVVSSDLVAPLIDFFVSPEGRPCRHVRAVVEGDRIRIQPAQGGEAC